MRLPYCKHGYILRWFNSIYWNNHWLWNRCCISVVVDGYSYIIISFVNGNSVSAELFPVASHSGWNNYRYDKQERKIKTFPHSFPCCRPFLSMCFLVVMPLRLYDNFWLVPLVLENDLYRILPKVAIHFVGSPRNSLKALMDWNLQIFQMVSKWVRLPIDDTSTSSNKREAKNT